MKKTLLLLILTLFLSCKANPKNGITWSWEIATAVKEAEKTGKPLLIHFTTDWCSWCKKMDAETYTDKSVIEKASKFIALKVDPEKGSSQSEFAKRYKVTGYPTILFLDSKQRVLHRVGGYQSAKDFLLSLEAALKSANLDEIIKKYEKGDISSGFELIEIYAGTNQYNEASVIIKKLENEKKIPEDKIDEYSMIAGFTALQNNEFKPALSYFKTVMKRNEIDKDELFNRGYLYYNYALFLSGDKNNAVQAIEKRITDKNLSAQWNTEFTSILRWMKESGE